MGKFFSGEETYDGLMEVPLLSKRRQNCLSLIGMGEYGQAIEKFRKMATQIDVPAGEQSHASFLALMCRTAEDVIGGKAAILANDHTQVVTGEYENLLQSACNLKGGLSSRAREKVLVTKGKEYGRALKQNMHDLADDIADLCRLHLALAYMQMVASSAAASQLIDVRRLFHVENMFKAVEAAKQQMDGS